MIRLNTPEDEVAILAMISILGVAAVVLFVQGTTGVVFARHIGDFALGISILSMILLLPRVFDAARARVEESQRESIRLREVAQARIDNLLARNRRLLVGAEAVARSDWFDEMRRTVYRNKMEVETKLLFPLARYLGYRNTDIELRVTAGFRTGEGDNASEADWVLYGTDPDSGVRFPVAVAQARPPSDTLDAGLMEQARFCASALNAPFYLVTNGMRLRVFRRDMPVDARILDCDIDGLKTAWPAIEQSMASTTKS
jgi:hypothetical protein